MPSSLNRKSNALPLQYRATRTVIEDNPEQEDQPTEPEPERETTEDSDNPDISDIQGTQARLLHNFTRSSNNINTSPRMGKGVPLECLVAAGERDRKAGKGLTDGGLILQL